MPRTVVIDEFPGDDYGTEWGEAAPQVATWLATTIVDDVEDLTGVQQEATTLAEAGYASGSLVEGVNTPVRLIGREDGETARLGGCCVEGVERRHTILKVGDRLQNDLLFLLVSDGDYVEEIGE